ncbi:YgaP family membrane protein [Desulforamulus aquiferis]|uniref:DUF2892 domain-containing protein n=1 Tax=Desulforamulus aquiferis TaxID=1397668 RepID=A0AAW7Z9N6_9FIRM|nr:DUF2892 domain-containing protein [Desulforamulus aquiferis]MDO7786026.1 DUF2892 domain-containing protein [Desulforamulus aquiferis]RYD04746.1 hypothetical protein N752_12530 [Desulforamulus aquiferis]
MKLEVIVLIKNVGTTDVILRITFGIMFLALAVLMIYGTVWSILFAILGIEIIFVAIVGFSPIYHLLGISTRKPYLDIKEEVYKWNFGTKPDSEK